MGRCHAAERSLCGPGCQCSPSQMVHAFHPLRGCGACMATRHHVVLNTLSSTSNDPPNLDLHQSIRELMPLLVQPCELSAGASLCFSSRAQSSVRAGPAPLVQAKLEYRSCRLITSVFGAFDPLASFFSLASLSARRRTHRSRPDRAANANSARGSQNTFKNTVIEFRTIRLRAVWWRKLRLPVVLLVHVCSATAQISPAGTSASSPARFEQPQSNFDAHRCIGDR